MRQSEFNLSCFRYYHEHVLYGILALYIDDMVLGGSMVFMENVVKKLREKKFLLNIGFAKRVNLWVGNLSKKLFFLL